LIAGAPGVGKSSLATALTERMVAKALEFCVFDPEGGYRELENAVTVGDAKNAPHADDVVAFLRKRFVNLVVNTQALSDGARPDFFARLFTEVLMLRARTGRPHWLVIDDAHHLLSASRDVAQILPERIPAAIFVTAHPDVVSPVALQSVEFVLALGNSAGTTIAQFCRAVGAEPPADVPVPASEEVVFWDRKSGADPRVVTAAMR
jgi:hypothetical protein